MKQKERQPRTLIQPNTHMRISTILKIKLCWGRDGKTEKKQSWGRDGEIVCVKTSYANSEFS